MLLDMSGLLLQRHIIALDLFMTLKSPLVILEGSVSRLKVALVVIDLILLSFTGIEVTSLASDCLYVTL